MVEFTFVSQRHPDGRLRRARKERACELCRMKKRRCCHRRGQAGPETIRRVQQANSVSEDAQEVDTRAESRHDQSIALADGIPGSDNEARSWFDQPVESGASNDPSPSQIDRGYDMADKEGLTPRFVGDLDPAARLLDDAREPAQPCATSPSAVGVWVRPDSLNSTSPIFNIQPSPASARSQQVEWSRAPISEVIATNHIVALSQIYFANIHPMVPLLNEDEYRQLLEQGKVPPALCHVVCLLASKDSTAGPNLRFLQSGDQAVPVREFCTTLYTLITNVITNASRFRKSTLVRILGLLSLHQEGPDGADQASSHLALACHHAQSLAIHLQRPNHHDNLEMKRVFWCLWTLDRLNAATKSRPCILHELDIGVEKPTPGELQFPAFDIWFAIASSLDKAIALYRPNNPEGSTGIELEFEGFEQLVDQMKGIRLPTSTLATLRIFYLATAILAYRLKTIRTLPVTTFARLRQQLSATQIIKQMKDVQRCESLHPLPVIVYGASLALSISYQQLRFSRLRMDQEEALEDFKASCKILQLLQQKWSSSDTMAMLAHRILSELEKLPDLSVVQVGSLKGHYEMNAMNAVNAHVEENPYHVAQANIPWQAQDQDKQQADASLDSVAPESPILTWNSDMNDLFSGMDDLSWMYLAAENPSYNHPPDPNI